MRAASRTDEFDYIVVGSGAGGGPVAANLAKAGMSVLLLEAGSDEQNYHYEVPCFHGLASEDPEFSWSFFVRHYSDEAQQAKDTKYRPELGGVFYPRAGTLGGCTAHNAMITVYPHDADWDAIASLLNDPSWRSSEMRRYFLRLERSDYARRPWALPRNRTLARLLQRIPIVRRLFDVSEHGFHGWLHTRLPDPRLGLADWSLVEVLNSAAREALASDLGRPLDLAEDLVIGDPLGYADPNTRDAVPSGGAGIWLAPLAVHGAKRNGSREYLKWVARTFPTNLEIRLESLAARVLFEGTRAVGVEYIEAAHAYRADPRCADPPPGEQPRRQVRCRREVILAGGAFNTPQLLKLSGVGPRAELESFDITVVADRPGVGENLQDRYEVGVVTEMNRNFSLLEGLTFAPPLEGAAPDPAFREWLDGKGLYATNGAVLAIVKKSQTERPLPDLFVFGLPAMFEGYYPGYSKELEHQRNRFTWAVLKAHTNNTAGYVRLRSADPRDVPEINFRYFDEGNDTAQEDLESVVDGVVFARELMTRTAGQINRELRPGPEVQTRDDIREFVRAEAWGHHASCTCKMGPASDPLAVVDGKFRVHGTEGLRVVDASVFPRIPGFFIVSAVYMIAEKASDVILEDVGARELRGHRLRRAGPRALKRLMSMTAGTRTNGERRTR